MALKKIGKFFTGFLVLLFLAIGTTAVYFYSKGYRINFTNRTIDKSGVLSIETTPRKATIFLNGKEIGKTPRAITGLAEGDHEILITKDGYQDWATTVTVSAEQSIPIEATLFYEEPEIDKIDIDDIQDYVVDQAFFDGENHIALFTTHSVDQTKLQVWGYQINRRFWELESDSFLITEFLLQAIEDSEIPAINISSYNIQISPDSQRALLSTNIDSKTKYYTFYTDRFTETPIEIESINQIGQVTPIWSNDSQYLVFSKNNELRTLNIDSLVQTVLFEKNESDTFVWTSTQNSQIYYIDPAENDYSINRIGTVGDDISPVLEEVTTQSSLTFVDGETSNTKFDVTDIRISDNGDYIILFEKDRVLIYSFRDDSYSSYPSENPGFISFSPDSDKFIYSNGDVPNLMEFTLEVENGDPVHQVGPKVILDIHTNYRPTGYRWLPDSSAILFSYPNNSEEHDISAISCEGLNIFLAISNIYKDSFAVGNSGRYLVSICNDNQLCKIDLRE